MTACFYVIARSETTWRSRDCFAGARNDEEGRDCFVSLAMTGRGGGNDGSPTSSRGVKRRGDLGIASLALAMTGREGIASFHSQ